MAIINCPECGRQVSNNAKACPYCGAPISKLEERRENIADSIRLKNVYANKAFLFTILSWIVTVITAIIISNIPYSKNIMAGVVAIALFATLPIIFDIISIIFIIKSFIRISNGGGGKAKTILATSFTIVSLLGEIIIFIVSI